MAELPFEYSPRISTIFEAILPNPTPEQQDAIAHLERRNRDLEDFLANVGGGGTAQSLIWADKAMAYTEGAPTVTTTHSLSVDIPNEDGFEYLLDWTYHLWVNCENNVNTQYVKIQGESQVSGQAPGVNFEKYGYHNWLPAIGYDEARTRLTGHGHFQHYLEPGSFGTTVDIDHTFWVTGTVPYVYCYGTIVARLFALPS